MSAPVGQLPYDNDTRTRSEQLRDRVLKVRTRARAGRDRHRLTNRDFTIIANDCWGAEVYRHLGLPYLTPFVGGFMFAPCFVRMLGDLPRFLRGPIEFTRESRYEWVNIQLANPEVPRYAIGVLGGEVEVHFSHYTEVEAREGYLRRVGRVNYDNLFIKAASGKELWSPELLAQFDALEYPRKVCLTDQDLPGVASAVKLKRYTTDGVLQFPRSLSQFDVVAWLNGELA